jgi:hypothetical protein
MMTRRELLAAANEMRQEVESHFQPDTAAQGFRGSTPSTGHCAAVSVLMQARIGGDFVSAIVDNVSHWFNRIETIDGTIDIDLTADQFGRDPIVVEVAGQLYDGTRVRADRELNIETLQRALLLAHRADMHDVAAHLQRILDQKTVAVAS